MNLISSPEPDATTLDRSSGKAKCSVLNGEIPSVSMNLVLATGFGSVTTPEIGSIEFPDVLSLLTASPSPHPVNFVTV